MPEIYDEYDFEELTIGQAKTKGKNIIAVTNAYSSGYINISTNLESGKVHYVVIRDDQIDGRYVCEIGENNFTHRMKKGSLYIVKILAEHAVENNFVYYRTFD